VALLRTDVSEKRIVSIIIVEIISELGTTLACDTFFRNVGSYKNNTAPCYNATYFISEMFFPI
jgi:hypothetical protein